MVITDAMMEAQQERITKSIEEVAKLADGVLAERNRLRAALAEIVVRTMPYQDDHEGWPLVAGVHRVAHDALAETEQ